MVVARLCVVNAGLHTLDGKHKQAAKVDGNPVEQEEKKAVGSCNVKARPGQVQDRERKKNHEGEQAMRVSG